MVTRDDEPSHDASVNASGRRTFLKQASLLIVGAEASGLLPVAVGRGAGETREGGRRLSSAQAGSPMFQLIIGGDGQPLLSCSGGTQPCLGSSMAKADPSAVHDLDLARATLRINRILANIASTRSDRDLMLIDVGGQVLLGWATHEVPPGAQRVTDVQGIRRALLVKDE